MKMRKEWGKKEEEENFTIILWRASKQSSEWEREREGISWAERSVQ